MMMDTSIQRDVPDFVFIFGIARRSGTNFLFQLLLLHEACRAGNVVLEDFFLAHADILEHYADTVYRSWNRRWRGQLDSPDLLLKHLGDGLTSFLDAESLKVNQDEGEPWRVVTKTPSVRNMLLCAKLFPAVKPIIIVRDGRSVVESSVRSFRRNYEEIAHEWTDAVGEIQALMKSQPADGYLLVRYEDLQQNTEAEVRKILAFLELDPAQYDFEAMRELPVFGSSQIVEEGNGKVHWKGEKFVNFDPNKRWQHWEQSLHERFNRIAGSAMAQFGYPLQPNTTPLAIRLLRAVGFELRWQLLKRILPWRKVAWRQWTKAKRVLAH